MTRAWGSGCAALLLALCAPLATAQVNALPSLPHLLVKGDATRDVVPDRFTVSITLSALDMQPEVARERVQANLGALLTVLKSGGAIAESIDASTFSVQPEHDYESQRRVYRGIRATRVLRVTFPNAEDTRAFLAKLPAGEDVQLGGIEPTFSGEAALRGELKAEAMRRTRETAALLATSYGARLGSLYSVSDVAPSFAYGIQAGQWPSTRGGTPPPPAASPAAVFERVQVTGSRITPESLAVGTVTIAEHLYAIFLLAD
ncbi:SIMPL domain-containing protein [Luteimonas sp. S4-F44]|uniref:SIMPL domain-containing protein n=1 Tax=Luteimonas sp. S4-F44 TaxID=2925842 RepID=UPI001F5364C6|nr:SIMPL domain-containing protein [Luteimonas sp. S4-F44]UNK41932.1 SIMPL domain-containing protein [Luteimonas sp. S4-F44]